MPNFNLSDITFHRAPLGLSRDDRCQLATLELEWRHLWGGRAVARDGRIEQLLPRAVLGGVHARTAVLHARVHLQEELAAFDAHVRQLFVERVLEAVDAVRVRLDVSPRQTVRRLDRGHLRG